MSEFTSNNSPVWLANKQKQLTTPFHEAWQLQINDPKGKRAFWLKFSVLLSKSGFKQIVETLAIFYQRENLNEISKIAVKQTDDIQSFKHIGVADFKVGDCQFNSQGTRGSVQFKGHSIQWDLSTIPRQAIHYELIPPPLKRAKLVKASISTVEADLRVTGIILIDGKTLEWNEVPAMQSHLFGTKNQHSWVSSACNFFINAQGDQAPFIFEGMSARGRLIGSIPTPRFTSLYFFYHGQIFSFNSISDTLRIKSKYNRTTWQFQAEKGQLSFLGQVKSQHKDFIGLTCEDTNGSLVYVAHSQLADIQIHIYRQGRLEASFYAKDTAAFEIASRSKNPYVSFLI